jgi:D-alanine transaminase
VRELAPVVDIDGSTVGDGRPGPVYARLLSAYRDAARRGLAPEDT